MADLYLTIDDSPSVNFLILCAYLKERHIPAVFFVRGDLLSLYPHEVIRAIKDGFVIANHSWSHHHASKLGAGMAIKEIVKTQKLIDLLYERAGKPTNRFMRFPHMDSGLGAWPLPPEMFTPEEQTDVKNLYATFYRNDLVPPDDIAIKRHQDIETALLAHGFRQMQFEGVTVPWYNRYAASSAVSTQGTFCHPDWYRYTRYAGVFAEEARALSRLNQNFDDFVAHNNGAHIIVMHDKAEIWDDTKALIDHMIKGQHNFLPIPV